MAAINYIQMIIFALNQGLKSKWCIAIVLMYYAPMNIHKKSILLHIEI